MTYSEAVVCDCKGRCDHVAVVDVSNPAKRAALSHYPSPEKPYLSGYGPFARTEAILVDTRDYIYVAAGPQPGIYIHILSYTGPAKF